MPFVLFDKREQMYVSRATDRGFRYTNNINQARVYKERSGAINAAGELDKSFEQLGKYPASKKLVIPSYIDVIEVTIEEGEVKEE